MNVLVLGSGGREHALCTALAQSPRLTALYCAPGNAGISANATLLALDPMDFSGVIAACRAHAIDFVIVGPEAPLCAGIVDALGAAGIKAFGPSAAAAQLEGSKTFTKDLCARHNIPTAAYRSFTDEAAALAYLETHPLPVVVKADALAAGKGVTIAMTREEAQGAVRDVFAGRFGAPSLVIEEFLDGEEASLFALVDGETVVPFGTAQDHKRVGDGDTGPNTGGMGAYSPAPVMSDDMTKRALEEIVIPSARAMAREGNPFRGFLYAGLMITRQGPKLIEYNVRFGDPEAQVVLPRLESDLLEHLLAACDGTLAAQKVRWRNGCALTVVLAARGYPGDYRKGTRIGGLETAAGEQTWIFHAGTARDAHGHIIATGGRVLNVTAFGPSVTRAQQLAYEAVARIDWPEGFCRRDIGWRAIARERGQS